MIDYRRDEGRPRHDEPAAPSRPETVKVPEEVWILLRKIAKARNLSKHAIFREAMDEYAEHHKHLAEGVELDPDD
jgi:hypothetical protein